MTSRDSGKSVIDKSDSFQLNLYRFFSSKLSLLAYVLVIFICIYGGCSFSHDFGIQLKGSLGSDYADPSITTPMILRSCDRLSKLLLSEVVVAEVNYLVWNKTSKLGFGEHAAIMLQFGVDEKREIFVIDIGRRPSDSKLKEISVLRIYDKEAYLKSVTSKDVVTSYSISWLCPNQSAKQLAGNVLNELAPFINRPEHDPIPWNYNLIFHNCARYVQLQLGEVMSSSSELKNRITDYKKGDKFINPTDLGEHLNACNLYAMQLSGKDVLNLAENQLKIRNYFSKLPDSEKVAWAAFLTTQPKLDSTLSMFKAELAVKKHEQTYDKAEPEF